MSTPAWHTKCRIREEVRAGALRLAEFAADLNAVRTGEAPAVYRDANEFFYRTFPTYNLKRLVRDCLQRLAGHGGVPVIRFDVSYGGGKTHTLITLLHLAEQATRLADHPTVREFVQFSGLQEVPRARVALLPFDKFDVHEGLVVYGPDGGTRRVRTPWGALAYQLAGDAGYARVKAHEDGYDPPAEPLLADLLREPEKKGLGTLLLLDEAVWYCRAAVNQNARHLGTLKDFFHSLVQATVKVNRCAFVATLISSAVEARDATGALVLQALEDEFAKTQRTRKIDTIDRAILVRVETSPRGSGDAEISIEELRELARSSGVEVFDSIIQYRPTCDPKFVLGKGKLSQLIMRAMQIGANLLIFDHELTPAQLRSIADFTEMKVIDRTQLILDIFAKRAQSREGKIQVELAQLKYRLPRLAKRDKALSRLAGGIGARGPGEQKLEIDRRRVRDRIHQLEREIEKIAQSRKQKKVSRIKKDLPIISIVGYTNAGKSTLLNTLTKSAVFTEDRLFATLDPKSARLRFPRDREAIITDTVGFIRNLPPDLFAAFRATLDELKDADVLLHLVDLSNPYFEEHIRAVEEILTELEIAEKPTLLVFNKIDRIEDKSLIKHLCLRFGAVAISALDPDSLNPLLVRLSTVVEELAFDGRGKEGYRESPEDTIKTETEEIWV